MGIWSREIVIPSTRMDVAVAGKRTAGTYGRLEGEVRWPKERDVDGSTQEKSAIVGYAALKLVQAQ